MYEDVCLMTNKEVINKIREYHNNFTTAIAIGSAFGGMTDEASDYISGLFEKYEDGILKEFKKG